MFEINNQLGQISESIHKIFLKLVFDKNLFTFQKRSIGRNIQNRLGYFFFDISKDDKVEHDKTILLLSKLSIRNLIEFNSPILAK